MLSSSWKYFGAPSLGVAVLLSLCAMPAAYGADTLKAEIPFAFQAGSKTLPAGIYEFDIHRDEGNVSILGDTKVKGAESTEQILCWLAPPEHQSANDAHVVFDRVGDHYILSELWQPLMGGILVHSTKEPHEHHVVHIKLRR